MSRRRYQRIGCILLTIGDLIFCVALLPSLEIVLGTSQSVMLVAVAYVCVVIGEILTFVSFSRGRKDRHDARPSKQMQRAIYAERVGVICMLLGGGTIVFAPLLFVIVMERAFQSIAAQPTGTPALMASGYLVGFYVAGPWIFLTFGALIWCAASIERRRAMAIDSATSAP